jgi:plasmid maintenance system antidote protein VapI
MLSRIFGTSAKMWLNMQRQYDLWKTLNSKETSKKIANVKPLKRTG